jgi:hypothetical protein
MRKSKYDYIDNISLYRIQPRLLAQCLGFPIRTVYTLRNNRLRHGKANEVIRDLISMSDAAFLACYHVRKRAMRHDWESDNE